MKQPRFAINTTQDPAPVSRTLLNKKGNLLVYMVVVLLIFGVLGVSLVSLFSTSTTSSATPNDAKRARLIAESGIRYALSEIRNSPDIETAAELLNGTSKFKLGKNGYFTTSVFSPGLKSAEDKSIGVGGGSLILDVPFSGIFPEDFAVNNAVNDVYIVDWLRFKGSSDPDSRHSAKVIGSTDTSGNSNVTVTVEDDFVANLLDTVCFALLATDAGTISRGNSIYVNEKAVEFFPAKNGAIRIMTSPSNQYDYFYEKRINDATNNRVELTNVREMPGYSWEDIGLNTNEYVILSSYNFRLFAKGTSDQITTELGYNDPIWALAAPSEYTIYMRELVQDAEIVGGGFKTFEGTNPKIEVGPGSSGNETFGDLWYGGDKSIGGNLNYCKDGRCLFDIGIRTYFTADVIPGTNGGQGFTFALIAGGDLIIPVNVKLSAGGDFQLPELLGYGGNSQVNSTPTYLDTTGDGLIPPKMAIEFDTNTDFDAAFNTSLAYCNGSNLVGDSRNDPQPENQPRDVVQYVFWGNNDAAAFNLACRTTPESYDDNRHDAEGEEVAVNFTYSVGAPIRSEPTYDATDQTLYFTSNYNGVADVWAINTDTGTLKWRYNAAGRNVTSKPALDTIGSERFVYFSAVDDLYKLKAEPAAPPAGESVWLRNVGGFLDKVSPVVDNNNHKIYIGSRETERFYAYDSDGIQLWIKDLNEDIEATAAIDKTGGALDGNVYVGTADDNNVPDGRLYGFAPDAPAPDPPPLWPYFITNNDVSSRPVLSQDGGVLYSVTDTGNVYAINAAGGAQIWANTSDITGTTDFIDPAVWKTGASADGTIYAANQDGDLYAFNPANGIQKWQKSLTGTITYSSPAVGPDGTIYIGTDGNRVYAINPDSSTKWEFPIPGGFDVRSTPEVGADRVVYVGADDGNLYALANVALPRNYRNTYVTGQRGYLTSANLDANVVVDDPDNWLDGAPLTKGPWAIRLEVDRSLVQNAGGNYEYTLRTWIRQCADSGCGDINGTPFQDTTGVYKYTPGHAPDLPFEQVIELTPAEHADFERFLFGFTTAAGASDTQLVEIRDFQLTFSRSVDPDINGDPTWIP